MYEDIFSFEMCWLNIVNSWFYIQQNGKHKWQTPPPPLVSILFHFFVFIEGRGVEVREREEPASCFFFFHTSTVAVPIMGREEEAHSDNVQEFIVKQHKGSSQTSQKTFQDDCDRISPLPDSLLLHILTKLKIEEVARTRLLSKRWKYLWTSIPCLDFRYLEMEGEIEKTTFIDWFLSHHDESKVDNLFLRIKYEEKHVQLVDSWIQFAIRHRVEELKLDLFDGERPEELEFSAHYTLYKLPHSLFTCGSLTDLELCGCDLNLPATIQLNSLKTLCFELIYLHPFAIERVTSNCPLLEDLRLISCNKSIDLNICITNKNLKNLSITEFRDYKLYNGITTITAPNLISMKFFKFLPRTSYIVEKLRSLEIVELYVGESIYYVEDLLYGKDVGYDVARLLHDLRYVKAFWLNSWCTQALTAKEIRGLDRMSINATSIQIFFRLTKWELPGIAYLLQSASYLETLEIWCIGGLPECELKEEFVKEYDFEEKDFWELWKPDSSSILQNTKSITVRGFSCSSIILVEDIKHWDKEIELVRILLKTAKVLETMTVETWIMSINDIELKHKITQELTSFPRASPNAELFII